MHIHASDKEANRFSRAICHGGLRGDGLKHVRRIAQTLIPFVQALDSRRPTICKLRMARCDSVATIPGGVVYMQRRQQSGQLASKDACRGDTRCSANMNAQTTRYRDEQN